MLPNLESSLSNLMPSSAIVAAAVKDLVDVTDPMVFVSHGYIYSTQ